MFQPKLNHNQFDNDTIYDVFEDNECITSTTQKDQIKTITTYINKYFHDNNYNDQTKIDKLTDNLINILTTFEFETVKNDQTNPYGLDYYELECSKKMITLGLIFSSFYHNIIVRLNFIYGLDNEVILSVNRKIYEDADIAEVNDTYHSVSDRGIYQTFLDPDKQSFPFDYSCAYYALGNSGREAGKDLNLNDEYTNIYNLFKQRIAAYKFYCLPEGAREEFTTENNKDIDVDYVLAQNIEAYEYPSMVCFNSNVNPICNDLVEYKSIDSKMIDYNDVISFICEIVMDSYMMDAFNVHYSIKNEMGKYSIDPEIFKKVNELVFNFYQYHMSIIDEISKMDINKNPMSLKKEGINTDGIIELEASYNSDKYNDICKDKVEKFNASLEENDDLEEEDKKHILDTFNNEINIKKSVDEYLREHVESYDRIYCPEKFFTIFNRDDINFNCWANIKKANNGKFDLSSIIVKDDVLYNKLIDINKKLRAKYNLTATLENFRRINTDYIKPICQTVNDINETINGINNIDMSDEVPDDNDYDDD